MLIVALDPPAEIDIDTWILHRYEMLRDLVQGFKIGLPAIIRYGVEYVTKYFRNFDGLLIADLKLADIGDVMALTTKWLRVAGFNAVIAHAFVGYKQGLDILTSVCKEEDIKLVLVVSMSHEGSREFIDKHLDEFLKIVEITEVWGIVAPATRLNVIKYIRSKMGSNIKILSPGVGVQGALPGDALCAGADYEIIGRTIAYADNVRAIALKVLAQQKEKVMKCRG